MNIEHATITEFSENGYLLETDKGYGFQAGIISAMPRMWQRVTKSHLHR